MKMRDGIVAFVAVRAMRAVALAEKEVLSAHCRNSGVRQNNRTEIFVGCERRGGRIILRVI